MIQRIALVCLAAAGFFSLAALGKADVAANSVRRGRRPELVRLALRTDWSVRGFS